MKREDDRGAGVSPEEGEYFRSIEDRFCSLRGASMLLSPRDWSLIAGWWEEGVPLALVLESLEEVFVTRKRRGDEAGRINSLAYVKPEISRRWRLHRDMTAARRGEAEETERLREDVRSYLGRVARSLKERSSAARERNREPLARTLLEVAAEVRRLRQEISGAGWDPMASEKILERLDAEVLQAAETSLDEADRLRVGREAEETLRPRRAAMRPQAYGESLGAVRRRLVRREFGLPHLSLLGEG